MTHFEFTGETFTTYNENVLHQIRATKDIPHHKVKAGDVGGFIEKVGNLPSENAWVASGLVEGNAVVTDHALVGDDSQVSGNAVISGRAVLSWGAMVSGNAIVAGGAAIVGGEVLDNAIVRGDAVVQVESDAVEGNTILDR